MGARVARNPVGTHGQPTGRWWASPSLPRGPRRGDWADRCPWAAQPSPLTAAGRSGRAIFQFFPQMAARTRPKPNRVWAAQWAPCPIAILTENLARIATSELTWDVAIQFKLGCPPPSESLSDSNSVAKHPGHRV
ncbi:hypothetical protein PCASD_19119 [Puccinia coronata f. sp. avenae]|uniref:Uncharacterized protein n=1 Tax=Puccinia coronata f. sp. avenae TaxID=200324 RepID=A0A2N5U1D7_9BASI|nr:hypothetical protein PCASD_19119 [Puccinia coronata f. sp. avenae]